MPWCSWSRPSCLILVALHSSPAHRPHCLMASSSRPPCPGTHGWANASCLRFKPLIPPNPDHIKLSCHQPPFCDHLMLWHCHFYELLMLWHSHAVTSSCCYILTLLNPHAMTPSFCAKWPSSWFGCMRTSHMGLLGSTGANAPVLSVHNPHVHKAHHSQPSCPYPSYSNQPSCPQSSS